jgi:hypothetical protein
MSHLQAGVLVVEVGILAVVALLGVSPFRRG